MGVGRLLDIVFAIYFLTHIPITIFVDSQAVIPKEYYPEQLIDLSRWYCETFKDPMMMEPPIWFKSFCVCELLVQLPFFYFAFKAFWDGYKKNLWVRIPTLVYAAHVATTLIPILAHVLFYDFTNSRYPGPSTTEERLKLAAIYSPYLIIPVLMLLRFLFGGEHLGVAKKIK